MMMQSFWALAASALFSIMAACVKLCTTGLGSFELVFYRSVFGAIFIAFFVLGKGQTLKTQYFGHHMIRSILGVASVVLWFFALSQMQFGTCMTLIYTTPLFMALNFIILAKMRGDKAPWLMTLAILAGFAGITAMLKPGMNNDDLIPALLCLAVAVIDLVSYWQMKRMGELNEPSWRIVFYFCVLGIVFAAVGTMFTGGFHMPDTLGMFGLLGMAVCATLGQICTTKSYAYGNMLLSSCLGFSAIPFSAITGVLLFDDTMDMVSLIGMTLILSAGMTAAVTTKKMEAEQKAKKAAQEEAARKAQSEGAQPAAS